MTPEPATEGTLVDSIIVADWGGHVSANEGEEELLAALYDMYVQACSTGHGYDTGFIGAYEWAEEVLLKYGALKRVGLKGRRG